MNLISLKHAQKGLSALCIIFMMVTSVARAQTAKDSALVKLVALRDDYISKINAFGKKPSLKAPGIVLDNPFSFGNYDDKTNILHIGDWGTLPPEGKAYFNNFAAMVGGGMTGEGFFELGVHQWIFVHELSHWWRACEHQTANHYEDEKGANRIATAFWRERDPAFYQLVLGIFKGIVDHSPNPVPAGQTKEHYLEEIYNDPNTLSGPIYSWYQSTMIVEISEEAPVETFKQAIDHAGKPL
jgi:hypothetical protein